MNKLIHWGCAAAWSAASVTPTMANTETATQKYPPIEVRDTPLEYRQFDRVEVTGSAILSKEAKDSLPLQVINRRDIERSGAASLSEVLHQLPVMLNFTESGTMTGTLSGGPEAAAIHGNQSGTLVLLNGRRLPIYGSQTIAGERAIVDLNFLPLAAIERIEILSDGASSRYGSDAVAGVVNVITRTDLQGVHLSVEHTAPQGGVAKGDQFSLSWGQGKTQRDGYSLQAYFTAQHQKALFAGDRSASRDSLHPLSVNGKEYLDTVESNQFFSLYSAPAYNRVIDGQVRNAYLEQYGNCPPGNYKISNTQQTYCFANNQPRYTVYPETSKQHVYLKGERYLSHEWIGFAEIVLGKSTQQSVVDSYNGYDNTFPDGSVALMTAIPLDVTWQRYTNNMHQAVVGIKGQMDEWNITSSLSQGAHQVDREYRSGILSKTLNLNDLALTPAETEQNPINYSPETIAKFAAYGGTPNKLDVGKTQLRAWDTLASKEVWETEHGPVSLGLGLSYRSESVSYSSASMSDRRPAFSGQRQNTALFAELQAPVTERLEATLSSRLDHYSDFGSITTSKLGGKWKQNEILFFRGSVGTGFRAPTMGQMTPVRSKIWAEQFYGSWIPVYFSGNPNLQPEKSTQTNLGFRLEPSKQWTLGMDWWHLQIKDTFSFYDGDSILNDPMLRSMYLITDGSTTYINAQNLNLGRSRTSGIDYDVQWRKPTDWGVFRWTLKGTYFIQSERQFNGSSAYLSDLGAFSNLSQAVTPRHQLIMRGVLEQGKWNTSAAINYRSGNTEDTYLGNLDGETVPFRHKVPSHWTLDLGARWSIGTKLTLGVAVNNALNKTPPLRLLTSGILQGVDTRYANYYGRTLKLKAEYKF